MKRRVLQISFALAGFLMLFRFGGPALIFGATGPGPFANRWLSEAKNPTLLMDADVRFFGAMMIGIGLIFFMAIAKIEAFGSAIYILACAVALGAAARIFARITYGDPGTAGTIPVVIEVVPPIVIIFTLRTLGKGARAAPK